MNAKRYEMGTRQILKMNKAIDENNQEAFLEALGSYNCNNACCGDDFLSQQYIDVFKKALKTFLN